MLGTKTNTVIAHYVWPTHKELKMMKERNVWTAHSPSSNRNLSSGIAPIKEYISDGLKIELVTDETAGSSLSIFRAMEDAITAFKIRSALIDKKHKSVTLKEAFYLATLEGDSFFGKVGSFKKNYEFDALVLDESSIKTILMPKLNLIDRLERFVYNSRSNLKAKCINGIKII